MRLTIEGLQPGDEVIVRRGGTAAVETLSEDVTDEDEVSSVSERPGLAKTRPHAVILPLRKVASR